MTTTTLRKGNHMERANESRLAILRAQIQLQRQNASRWIEARLVISQRTLTALERPVGQLLVGHEGCKLRAVCARLARGFALVENR